MFEYTTYRTDHEQNCIRIVVKASNANDARNKAHEASETNDVYQGYHFDIHSIEEL